jgi:hypothetical protein
MSLAQILANVEQLQKEQADIYDSGQRYSDQLAPGAYGRLGDQMFIDQTDGGTFKDPYFESLMYGNPNLIEDYFSTGRFENFNPRVGILASPQVQNTSIDSIDYDEENVSSFIPKEEQSFLDILKMLGQGALGFATDIPFIGQGITGLANMLGDTFKGSRFYNPRTASGNRLFAPGARAGDAFGLNFRRDANRFGNMLNRLSQGKNIGRTNLQNIMDRRGLTGIDVGGMADSIAQSATTGYGVGDVGNTQDQVDAGRDYSDSPGAMAGDMEYGEE